MDIPKTLEQVLTPETLIFGLTVQNIPTMNLRAQYAHDREMVFAEGLAEGLHARVGAATRAAVSDLRPRKTTRRPNRREPSRICQALEPSDFGLLIEPPERIPSLEL